MDLIQTETKNKIKIQLYFVSENRKINKLLGWNPTTEFMIGLKKLILWQKNNLIKL